LGKDNMDKIIIGADPFPPYQYINGNGKISGSDYKKIKKVVELMDYKAEFVIKEWSVIEKMFSEKKIDILFQVQKTQKREELYFFSDKFRDAITTIVTSINKVKFKRIDDIFEYGNLGVERNYQYGEIIDSIDKKNKVFFKSLNELLEAVNNKEVSFGVADLEVYKYLDQYNSYNEIEIIESLNFNRPLYVMFNSQELRDEFNIYFRNVKK